MAVEYSFIFPLQRGLHARPASALQQLANGFHSRITLVNEANHKSGNAKSALALIGTDTSEQDPCRLLVSGDDEQQALSVLQAFLREEFLKADDGLERVPDESSKPERLPYLLKKNKCPFSRGQPAAAGMAWAPAWVVGSAGIPEQFPIPEIYSAELELAKLEQAMLDLRQDLEKRISQSNNSIEMNILQAHLAILTDNNFKAKIISFIFQEGVLVGIAIKKSVDFFCRMLLGSHSTYLQERVLDIHDLACRLISLIYGDLQATEPVQLQFPVIVITDILTPSQLLSWDKKYVKGLVCSQGGLTSHSAILARSRQIPMLVNIPEIHKKIASGQELIVDGFRGLLFSEVSERVRYFYQSEQKKLKARQKKWSIGKNQPGQTAEKKKLLCAANVGFPEELATAFQNGAEGIGLFRSEFIFLDRQAPPDEAEQLAIYRQASQIAKKKPVIIRLLDIGGDKPSAYLNLPKEDNPFLGYRAVRLYHDHEALLKSQLRAILRASTGGNFKIMVPMIATVEEVVYVKKLLGQAQTELTEQGFAFDKAIEFGIMLEVPAAAFIIDLLAREVDFFSIGTNDLLQYVQAADRGNPRVSHLNQVLHPSFLRLLQHISHEVQRQGKWLGMCGEMAGRKEYLPLLVGLELAEISMASSLIPQVKADLQKLSFPACQELLNKALSCATVREVEQVLTAFHQQQNQGALIQPDLISLDSPAQNKEQAIKEMVDILDMAGRVEDPDAVEQAIWQREEVYSTGIGFGVAIPHCQSAAVRCNSIVFIRFKKPIPWQSLDNQSVSMAFLLAIRAGDQEKEHLKIIARLSRQLMHEEFRASLKQATNVQTIPQTISQPLLSP